MTIQERMVARSEREKDLLKYGRSQERERIIKLLEATCDCAFYEKYEIPSKCHAHKHIALIKGETNEQDE